MLKKKKFVWNESLGFILNEMFKKTPPDVWTPELEAVSEQCLNLIITSVESLMCSLNGGQSAHLSGAWRTPPPHSFTTSDLSSSARNWSMCVCHDVPPLDSGVFWLSSRRLRHHDGQQASRLLHHPFPPRPAPVGESDPGCSGKPGRWVLSSPNSMFCCHSSNLRPEPQVPPAQTCEQTGQCAEEPNEEHPILSKGFILMIKTLFWDFLFLQLPSSVWRRRSKFPPMTRVSPSPWRYRRCSPPPQPRYESQLWRLTGKYKLEFTEATRRPIK